jgi:mono/diheme cytochrome c family protein
MFYQISTLILFAVTIGWFTTPKAPIVLSDEQSVYKVLQELGDDAVTHELNSLIPGVSAERGRELFLTGYTTLPNGQRTKKQSKHFVCTSGHNNVREEYDIGNPNPETRLTYAVENELPYLQGTTLHGVVNRVTFYNGDYHKKYGRETVDKVKENLRESIQLCAVGCAQGRALGTWEIESVLAYFWTLELEISDLKLNQVEREQVIAALHDNADKEKAIEIIHSKYNEAAPATFADHPDDYSDGYDVEGNAERGEVIYGKSCLHCHENGRYSYYSLDKTPLSLNHLKKNIKKAHSPYNTYNLIIDGTLPVWGEKAYMPQYPLERMSIQQMEDLRAYLETNEK